MLFPLPCVCQMIPPSRRLMNSCADLMAHILMDARELLLSVKEHKVADDLDEPVLVAHPEQVFVELEAGVVALVFFPAQVVFSRGCRWLP